MTTKKFKINGPKKQKDQVISLVFLERNPYLRRKKDHIHNVLSLSLYNSSNIFATFKFFSSKNLKETLT